MQIHQVNNVENAWKILQCPTSGEEYYFNSVSGESQWEIPKEVHRNRRASRVAVAKLQQKLQAISERTGNGSVSTASSYTPSLERQKKKLSSNAEQGVKRDSKHQELLDKLGALVSSNDIPSQKQPFSVQNKKRPDKRKIHVENCADATFASIQDNEFDAVPYSLSLPESSVSHLGNEVGKIDEENNHAQQSMQEEHDVIDFSVDKGPGENPLQQPTIGPIYNPLIQPFEQNAPSLTKDYIALAKEYKRLEEYRLPRAKTLCVQCKVNQSNMVFFPCEHGCVCDICCASQVRKRRGLKCPICKDHVKLSLRRRGKGKEKAVYWKWVYEVKPHLDPNFVLYFKKRSAAAIKEKLAKSNEQQAANENQKLCCMQCSIS